MLFSHHEYCFGKLEQGIKNKKIIFCRITDGLVCYHDSQIIQDPNSNDIVNFTQTCKGSENIDL
jgi:hypothetical protein